jgi:next-to-BRCA1 protein 1
MGHVDSNHPAGIVELISASESTVCYNPVAPGEEFPFTVLLRTPARAGNLVSYWRLTAPSGHKFGDRLWCDVSVRDACPKVKPEVKPETEKVETPVEEVKQAEDSQASSQMIFPKLEKESPVASIHEAAASETVSEPEQVETKTESGDDEWDISEDGFMTDEEYDILDASDEEYLEEQKKQLAAK